VPSLTIIQLLTIAIALIAAYPDHDWYRPGKWKDIKDQRKFLDNLGVSLGIKNPDDWYNVPVAKAIASGGTFIKSVYNTSLVRALNAAYPEHSWKRTIKDAGYWADKANQRGFMDQLAVKFDVKKPEDWYKVTLKMAIDAGGSFISNYYQSSLVRGKLFVLIIEISRRSFRIL
jgi:hypothetical protein